MKKCAFCRHPADSPEHIFSDWMLALLPPEQRFVCNERIVSRDEYISFPRRKLRFVAKTVCTRCYNGWMSRLESALKKVIGNVLVDWDKTAVFTPEKLQVIAAFAFKTLVIANHKNLAGRSFFTYAQRSLFRRRLVIPEGVDVWMATRHQIAGKYYGFWKSVGGQSANRKRFPYGFSMYSCTWNFQNILLQAVATKWKSYALRKIAPPLTFAQDERLNPACIHIWPFKGANLE